MAPFGMLIFPNEILHQICMALLDTYNGHRYLGRFSQTCRTLCDIAQRLIYHDIEIPHGSLALVLRTLLARPDLASSVRSMTVQDHDEIDEIDFPLFEDAATRLGIKLPEQWEDVPGLPTDLLLGLIPAIERLDYTMDFEVHPGELLAEAGISLRVSETCV